VLHEVSRKGAVKNAPPRDRVRDVSQPRRSMNGCLRSRALWTVAARFFMERTSGEPSTTRP
jgi:hypothetical protein